MTFYFEEDSILDHPCIKFPLRSSEVKVLRNLMVPSYWYTVIIAGLAVQGCVTPETKPVVSELSAELAKPELTTVPSDLKGDWCYEKKRRITRYSLKEDKLFIRGGRSGQTHELDLSCYDDYTVCKTKSVRGWGSPVTEILTLDGHNMSLTRIWGGSWNDKSYSFTYTRCPRY